jgi:hypothetical protein
MLGERPLLRAHHPQLGPLPHRTCVRRSFQIARDGRGQPHLQAPGMARHPTRGAELVGSRGQCIRHRAPDVLAPVAVEVVGERMVFRRHELREAHGARPRTLEVLAGAHPVLQQLEGRHQLVAEQLLAPAEKGLGGQRLDHVMLRAAGGAVGGLAPPDGQHDRRRHAQLALDALQRRAVLGEQRLALHRQALQIGGVQILGGRSRELGLALHLARALAGQHQIRHCQIKPHSLEGRIEGAARHARGIGLRPQRLDELPEAALALGAHAACSQRKKQGGRPQNGRKQCCRTRCQPPPRAHGCPPRHQVEPCRVSTV